MTAAAVESREGEEEHGQRRAQMMMMTMMGGGGGGGHRRLFGLFCDRLFWRRRSVIVGGGEWLLCGTLNDDVRLPIHSTDVRFFHASLSLPAIRRVRYVGTLGRYGVI